MNTIGDLEIYPKQLQAAKKIMNAFTKGQVPILISQPQQGKTGTCIAVINMFKQYCQRRGLTYEVYFGLNQSDNVLEHVREGARELFLACFSMLFLAPCFSRGVKGIIFLIFSPL